MRTRTWEEIRKDRPPLFSDSTKVTEKIQEVGGAILTCLRDVHETLILMKEVLIDNQKILLDIRDGAGRRTPLTGKLDNQPPLYEPEVK